ncbi:hypothetical protein [Flavobacterium sp. NKUCC04_CG]|uniref:hypothetical protein n=1 Tax=Flavobacterium sp. NKUCC04_CG TaxID=2842121 RepID=UPI001C5AD77F|nr:hypothetical protein [Flavobacterium sp. NKUCC04_CG]MBW3518495.1 hypothetical protein [Flavobacterium sp. NKUCC04_CG]
MRNLILVCILFFCSQSHAQFRYVDQFKVAGPVVITFKDGTVQSGIVKYHNPGNLISRDQYKSAFKAFKSTKKQIISENRETKQLSIGEATTNFRMRKDLYYIAFLNDKYAEFCK